LFGIYQAAQNMALSHLGKACPQISSNLKEQFGTLRNRKDNANYGGKQYWADGCRVLGCIETEHDGLRLAGPTAVQMVVPPPSSTSPPLVSDPNATTVLPTTTIITTTTEPIPIVLPSTRHADDDIDDIDDPHHTPLHQPHAHTGTMMTTTTTLDDTPVGTNPNI
jgi:hypothetical protein